jgi:isoleucyl-tRNA synthetase
MGVLGHYDDPYMTIAPRFEGAIVDVLADLAEAKQLYKGLRATLWCVHDETALAEAEIEYHDHVSDSIYVRFPATAAQRADISKRFGVADENVPLSIAIWTTTPWTLPANVAIAVKPDAEYSLYRVGDEDIVVAEALAEPARATAYCAASPKATGSRARACGIRSSIAIRSSSPPIMSNWKPEPAPCTLRPVTVPTTS